MTYSDFSTIVSNILPTVRDIETIQVNPDTWVDIELDRLTGHPFAPGGRRVWGVDVELSDDVDPGNLNIVLGSKAIEHLARDEG